jgi:hypothetical protein
MVSPTLGDGALHTGLVRLRVFSIAVVLLAGSSCGSTKVDIVVKPDASAADAGDAGDDVARGADAAGDSSHPMDSMARDVISKDSPSDTSSMDTSACPGTPPAATSTTLSNPTPTMTMPSSTEIVLHMELDAFANYGAMDCQVDIVYSGQVGAWTFTVPTASIASATVVASIIADDHSTVTDSSYTYTSWSDHCSYPSTSSLPHGTPEGTCFTDWIQVTYPATVTSGGTFTFTLANTSTTSDLNWIGVDWIELHITTT